MFDYNKPVDNIIRDHIKQFPLLELRQSDNINLMIKLTDFLLSQSNSNG